jgi:hypothetical protein
VGSGSVPRRGGAVLSLPGNGLSGCQQRRQRGAAAKRPARTALREVHASHAVFVQARGRVWRRLPCLQCGALCCQQEWFARDAPADACVPMRRTPAHELSHGCPRLNRARKRNEGGVAAVRLQRARAAEAGAPATPRSAVRSNVVPQGRRCTLRGAAAALQNACTCPVHD